MQLVLLVEDHHDSRQMYAEVLSDTFQVIQAADGEEALAAMSGRRPDLVVTDFSLPGFDGFELIARMRNDPALATVPAICLSGHGGSTYERRAREVGCDRLLQKPCLPDALVAAVVDLLRDGAQRKHS